jgi:hypothetical protein
MLVCNVSLRPPRTALAAGIVEAGAAADAPGGIVVLVRLVDAPASARDTSSAFTGEILKESGSAVDTYTVGLAATVLIDAPANVRDQFTAFSSAGITAPITEAATANSVQDGAISDAWTLVNSWTYSTGVPQVDFTGLAGYSEIRVLLRLVSCTGSGIRQVRVSTNNGSTFLSTSGDYVIAIDSGSGTVGNQAEIQLHTLATTAARSAEIVFKGWNLTDSKTAQMRNRIDFTEVVIPTTSALNALRIFDISGGNLSGGSIYVWGRR